MRTNIYKEKILEILASLHVASIQDIHARLGEGNFSTVYRNIESLVEEGIVKQVIIGKDKALYERVVPNHDHDHFVCDGCGKVEAVVLKRDTLVTQGIVRDVVIHGTCRGCPAQV